MAMFPEGAMADHHLDPRGDRGRRDANMSSPQATLVAHDTETHAQSVGPAPSPISGDELSSSPPKSVGKIHVIDRYHKRGRVESAGYGSSSSAGGEIDPRLLASSMVVTSSESVTAARANGGRRRGPNQQRSTSLPSIQPDKSDALIHNIFPDLNPRELRLAEVRSWECAWMTQSFPVTSDDHPGDGPRMKNTVQHETTRKPRAVVAASDQSQDVENAIKQLNEELSLEDKVETATPPPSQLPQPKSIKRPTLRLKLEDMPTPQQAEDRAQRAANRIIARREAMERAMQDGSSNRQPTNGTSASQQAIMRLNLKSYSSGDDSDVASPTGRQSVGSSYSPNHGMFTTKSVAVSEAGISSPDTPSLHLQENLKRVREIGRGASGVVYKAIHIPTLKVVAIKDVSVYGRGQRRQMVRELHALYSNLVPIVQDDDDATLGGTRRQSNGKPRASPHIVSFYDAFVDRAKNCICLVMEYMSAGSLQDIVLRGGCQNEKVLSRLAGGVLQGLSHIHKKRMVHRDIKPHNLLANRQGDVKISDFGLAKTLSDNAGMTKTFVGTLLYMAPERIGGGDYSYPADVWSFGLVLVSVALGKYPLPTQDGFFGLVDSVSNEQHLELPADQFSPECREFVQLCLRVDPEERPSANALLEHPFITEYSHEDTLQEWMTFVEEKQLCEERAVELNSLGEAVYRHIYERSVQFSNQPQSDYGVSFATQSAPPYRREVSIQPVQMSLQLGLANYLGVPVHSVYEVFEAKRGYYSDKLLEEYCYSPQSWTASPGMGRRQQLFGSDVDSPRQSENVRTSSFWKKLQDGLTKFKSKRKKSKDVKEVDDRLSSRNGSRG